MIDELGVKIVKTFAGLRSKTYSYLIDDSSKDKKTKSTKKCVISNFQKQLHLIMKQNIWKKNKIDIDSLEKIIKD